MTIDSKWNPALRSFDMNQLKSDFGKVSYASIGRVSDVVGTVIEAKLPQIKLGMVCEVSLGKKNNPILTEVVGFKKDKALLLPYSHLKGLSPGSYVKRKSMYDSILVGDHLLGRIVDPFMQPLRKNLEFNYSIHKKMVPLENEAINPLERSRIKAPLPLGVRSVDSLLTFGEGQRIGIFAGSGVGKSVLMGMFARGSEADCNVIGLIGERGREVREFIEKELGEEGLEKSVVVVVTSDQSPLLRLRAAKAVTAIAEYFSSQGKKVLLMLDSLTRVAQAQREIGLAVGEPPTTKGYPPSVFSLLPRLLERCGPQAEKKGSISGIYTVLVDGDDFNDPMPDTARAILDGHIVLSRDLANMGHFPAIDVNASISRVMPDIVGKNHQNLAMRLKSLLAVYNQNFDYVQLGSYVRGTNPKLDEAIYLMPLIEKFLCQDMHQLSSMEATMGQLAQIFQEVAPK